MDGPSSSQLKDVEMESKAEIDKVLDREIPWESYLSAKLINGTGLQLLKRYDHKSLDVKANLLKQDGPTYVHLFLTMLHSITEEKTVEYVLALVDEMLSVNPALVSSFYEKSITKGDVYKHFFRLLTRPNWFIQEKSCKILVTLIGSCPKNLKLSDGEPKYWHLTEEDIQHLVDWICNQLRKPSHPLRAIPLAVSCLATLLRGTEARRLFVRVDGIKLLAPLIASATSQHYVQVLYDSVLCLWLLSFYGPAADSIAASRVLPRLIEVAKTSTKEKVVRVSILTLKNLFSKGTFASDMVELGLPKTVQTLKLQAWTDEDLLQALDSLEAALKDNIHLLSSFEKYKQEVLSGNLDWTPMHKDPGFWKENINKYEENDFQILRVLVAIIDHSRDPKTQAIACNDLAKFIQNHPAGRGIVLDLRAKDRVMKLMNHENAEVRKEALLCVQKLLLGAKYASYLQ